MRHGAEQSAYEYFRATFELRKMQNDWIEYWRGNQLDLVLAPGYGSQAQPHGMSKVAMLSAAYTFIWNVLEMIAGALPITVVREEEQSYDTVYSDMVS